MERKGGGDPADTPHNEVAFSQQQPPAEKGGGEAISSAGFSKNVVFRQRAAVVLIFLSSPT